MTTTIDLDKLSAAKRELMLLRLRRTAQTPPPPQAAAIPSVDRQGLVPLSWTQQRLWFLDQLDKTASLAYHMPAALRLSGPLNVEALRATMNALVARHEVLRTRMAVVDGEPVQAILAADTGFALAEYDVSALAPTELAGAVERQRLDEAAAPFDLEHGPLARGRLLKLAPQEHELLVTLHHIVSDGWSIGILLREVSQLYAAFCQGKGDPLPPLPIQYADYAAWQRGWLQGGELERQLGFWRQQLAGAPALLELPADRERPATQSYAGATYAHTITAATAAGLRSLAQRHGATLFMTLMAGWSALLSRLSGQRDVVIGTPVANRRRSELEGLIGYFANTLALRVSLTGDDTVASLLADIKSMTLAAYEHQDLPFEQVVEAVRPPRSMGHSPLFQVMLSMDNTPPSGAAGLHGLTIGAVEQSSDTTQFDLTLDIHDDGVALQCTWHYCRALYDAGTIAAWSRHFAVLLSALSQADDGQAVALLPVLDAQQYAQQLVLAQGDGRPGAAPALMHTLFEAQAARTPDALAVCDTSQQLSFSELNRRANVLAHRLRLIGVQPDQRVAIYAERSVEMVAGMLAILKAGGAYVPLDPSYPAERLAYMLADSAPVALLAQPALAATLPGHGLPLLPLEPQPGQGDDGNIDPASIGLAPHHLAYVMYTSGSTGKPKGAMNQHDGSITHLLWTRDYFQLGANDRLLQKTPVGFDVSVMEIFVTLLSGVPLVMAKPGGHTDPAYICQTIVEQGITVAHFVPSMLGVFLEQPEAVQCRSLRMVVCSGEMLPYALYQRFADVLPGVALHNLYGPTETAVHMTAWACAANPEQRSCIGKPIAGSTMYVLDAHRQLLPRGATGELYIGGAVVGRGYLNRPALTAERYLPDQFLPAAGATMYRSGDLGRWLPDGTIEYLGRNDFQVKLRGLRIELGEIEACLRGCAGVRDALVLARRDGGGDPRLVAYLLGEAQQLEDSAALRSALAAQLPEYMVPALYVVLDAWPLTPSGKLDRLALPAPDAVAGERIYRAPEGEIERTLAGFWQQLLGVERVGRDDHFFDLGGHSMLAMRLHAMLRKRWGGVLALRDILAAPELHVMAAGIAGRGRQGSSTLVPLRAGGSALPLFLVHSGGGEVSYGRRLLPWLDPQLPVYGLAASGQQDDEPLPASVPAMAGDYIAAMRAQQPQGPYRLAGWSAGGTIACEMARQLLQAGASVSFIGLIDSHFDYRDGEPVDETPAQMLLEWLAERGADAQQLAQLQPLAAADAIDGMLDVAIRQEWIPAGLERGWLHRHIALRQAILAALKAHRMQVPDALIHHFSGLAPELADLTLGWSAAAGERLRHVPIGGNHGTIVTEPHVQRLALAINQALAERQAGDL